MNIIILFSTLCFFYWLVVLFVFCKEESIRLEQKRKENAEALRRFDELFPR